LVKVAAGVVYVKDFSVGVVVGGLAKDGGGGEDEGSGLNPPSKYVFKKGNLIF